MKNIHAVGEVVCADRLSVFLYVVISGKLQSMRNVRLRKDLYGSEQQQSRN